MRIYALAAVGALAMAGVALAAAPEPQAARGRLARHPDMEAMQREVGLSPEQAAQLSKMWSEQRKQSIRQRADTAIARMELEELLSAPTVDEKAVAMKVKALSDLHAAALKARIDHRLAVRRILSPEQQEKMKQLMRERFRDRGQGRERAWRRQRPGRGSTMAPPPGGPGGPDSDDDGDPDAPPPVER
jgi:Spy/CpxP family protein refolding chaperone